jgi:histidinol-phosphatase
MIAKQKILFIDRDGTLILEPPVDFQVDSLEKLEFYPGVFQNLSRVAANLSYKLVMVTNQDGLGTSSFPEDTFWPAQNKMMAALEGEGIRFDAVHIDPTLPEENAPTRKPRTGMLTEYFGEQYDLANSLVIGDRLTDVELAKNLGCKAILMKSVEDGEKLLADANLTEPLRVGIAALGRGCRLFVPQRPHGKGGAQHGRDEDNGGSRPRRHGQMQHPHRLGFLRPHVGPDRPSLGG